MKISLLFLIIGFLCLVACSPQTYSPPADEELTPPTTTEPEPEPEPEPQLVEVPISYEVVEAYAKEDVLVHQSSIEIGGIGSAEDTWEEPIFIACVTIRNADSVSGTFTVSFSVDNPLDDFFLTTTLELAPGETGTAECPAYSLGSWSCKVIPSTKLIEQ